MQLNAMFAKYLDAILSGNRVQAREVVRKVLSTGVKAQTVYSEMLIPAMNEIDSRYRREEISSIREHLAIRINRFITDQVQAQLIPGDPNGKIAVVVNNDSASEELGGQMCADLLESAGWQCFFLGCGVAEDELIEMIGKVQPELLVVYGSSGSNVPVLRQMIERIRDIGASPMMNVMALGGIFQRVDGLWQEVQADGSAEDPVTLLDVVNATPEKTHMPKDPHAPKRRRRLSKEAVAAR